MRALLIHCKEVEMEITGLSTRPVGIIHGPVIEKEYVLHKGILALITVENGDNPEKASLLVTEIIKFCQNTGRKDVFVCPFGHLSNNLAPSDVAHTVFEAIEKELTAENLQVIKGHFGSDKEYLIHAFGHAGNTRYREF